MTAVRKRATPRGIRVPQQARSRRTRERILRAAVACFEELGYDATTTALIARRARTAVGTLYGYFPDKRALLLELLQDTSQEIADRVVQGLDPAAWRRANPRASVRRLIDAVFHAHTVSPGLQRILWERYFKDLEFRDAVQKTEQRVRGALEELLRSLQGEGRLLIQDPSAAAFVIYTSVEWTAARLVLGEADDAAIDASVEAASDMVSRFLFPAAAHG